MKLAVTGCNGRVGRRVCKAALDAGHVVHGIDSVGLPTDLEHAAHPNFAFSRVDLRDYDTTVEALQGSDAVVQLAAIPTPTDYRVHTHNANVVISWNVLRGAAELGITKVVQASSVNVVSLVWSVAPKLHYLPLDEDHPREPDEPYGLSKLIAEMQADTIVRRYPHMRVASLRPSWSIPSRALATREDPERRKNDLWGYVQQDSCADAFLRAATAEGGAWSGHEAFFIAAPGLTEDDDPVALYEKYWTHVPIKEGKDIRKGFFDCSKAERILGWVHQATD